MLLFARSFHTLWEYAGYDRLPDDQMRKMYKKQIGTFLDV